MGETETAVCSRLPFFYNRFLSGGYGNFLIPAANKLLDAHEVLYAIAIPPYCLSNPKYDHETPGKYMVYIFWHS